MMDVDIEKLIPMVMDCAVEVKRHMPPGYDEKVYQNAMMRELSIRNIPARAEVPCEVLYKGVVVGQDRCDIIVDNRLILELKSVLGLIAAHEVQLVNYLNVMNIETGLLINFGSERIEIKRKYKTYRNTRLFSDRRT